MHDIAEATKMDTAIHADYNVTSATGPWFRMTTFAKGMFFFTVYGQLTGASLDFDVYEATDATGSGESQLGATIAMTQGSKVAEAACLCASVQVGDTVILTPYTFDGQGQLTAGTALTYTAAAAESLPDREFDQSGSDTACGVSLAANINDATYGVPGLLATADTGNVTITLDEPGDGAFDITELAAAVARLVVTDIIQQAYFEVAVQDMDRDNDFTHIGARVSGVDATSKFCSVLVRAIAGYQPVGQAVISYDDAV